MNTHDSNHGSRVSFFTVVLLMGAYVYPGKAFPDSSPKYVFADWSRVSYTVINVPYSAMLGVISPSPRTRTVASTCRFVGAFGAAFLISLFVRPLVKYLGMESEVRGFQLTMAIFAFLSVILILTTFATTKERVTPPPQQKSNAREELGELFKNWPWVVLLVTSIFSNAFSALRSGSTIFYFKYVQGYDSTPFIWTLDRTTLFLTSGALGLVLGTMCLGPIARKVDKKYYAAGLSLVTGLCFLAFFFVPKGQFGLMIALNIMAQFCAGPTSALTWALYADVADYGEVKCERRSTGLIYSASLFVGGFLVPSFLARFGYGKGGATQTVNALLGITFAFSIGPSLFALLKSIALVIYPLGQKCLDGIERELATRRAICSCNRAFMNIHNPILPGFNPDPSIIRVGDDYYIATSTFEWFPGVQIHRSRDLIHWRLLTRPLNRASQLNMPGDPDSCGVWAPCLSYADGLFWLIYTDVKRFGRTTVAGAGGSSLRDFHNYLVTSPRIDGNWSDPIYLNSSGFDPSLFHDDDGRKYLVNQLWDHRPGNNRFAGIVLQAYSAQERKLIGERVNIFKGTPSA